jgi:hypothetical protein
MWGLTVVFVGMLAVIYLAVGRGRMSGVAVGWAV